MSRALRRRYGHARKRAWRIGEFFRQEHYMHGLEVWRVIQTFGADSPYVLGLDITESRRQPAGSVKRMIAVKDIVPVKDPLRHLAGHMLTGKPKVSAASAQWG